MTANKILFITLGLSVSMGVQRLINEKALTRLEIKLSYLVLY